MKKIIFLVALATILTNTAYAENKVGIHGLIGVNLISQKFSPKATSEKATNKTDIELADVELNVIFKSSDKYDGSILIIKEDDKVIVDEAVLNYHGANFDLSAGQMVVPFGAFETGMISDPLTLEYNELNINALLFSKNLDNGIDLSAYVFNGAYNSNDETLGEDKAKNRGINNFGFSINYENKKLGLKAGFDYINSIAEGAGWTKGAGTSSFNAGLALRLGYDFGVHIEALKGFSFSVEHITAVKKFEEKANTTFVDEKGKGIKPSLTHIELNYEHKAFSKEANFALSSGSTDYELGTKPNRNKTAQTGFAWSIELEEGVSFGIEVLNKTAYNGDKIDIATTQWTHEF